MGEPLSIAASVAGLISLGIQVSERLIQFYSAVHDARHETQSTRCAIKELRLTLTSIKIALEKQKNFAPNEVASVESSVLSCQDCINRLEKKLHKFHDTNNTGSSTANAPTTDLVLSTSNSKFVTLHEKINDSKGRLLYPFRASTLAKLRENVQEMKENLALSLQVLNLTATTTIFTINERLENLESGLQRLVLSETNAKVEKLMRWLYTCDALEVYRQALDDMEPGSGGWFLEGEQMVSWQKEPGSLYWLHGIPGCGKTVLASSIIERVRATKSDETVLCVYYFRFDDPRRRKFHEFVASMVLQCSLADLD